MIKKIALSAFLIFVLSPSGTWVTAAQENYQENQPEEVIVPEGTVIPVIITAYLNTRSTQEGDTVYAETIYPVWIQQRLVIPKGSSIRGTVTEVEKPGKIQGKGRIAVRFDDILLPNGVKRGLIASFRSIHSNGDVTIDRKTESIGKENTVNSEDLGAVVGTATSGAIAGAVYRGASRALVGGGVGAAGGLATVLLSRNRDLVINPGTQFDLELKRALKFAYSELEFTGGQISSSERAPRTAPPSRDSTSPRRIRPGGLGTIPGIRVPLPY
jgi:hypothetical protein